jgi:hypothetical protein
LIDESEIRELDRIRNRLGISPLRGSLLEDVPLPDQQEAGSPFAHQLRAEFGSDLAGHATAAMEGTVTGTAGTVAGRPNAGRTSPESLEYRRRSLRSLGRRLDALAHDFEELELFDEADQLRTISSEIRHKNRNP